MIHSSVELHALKNQDNIVDIYFIYCPMCEEMHENNTLCQMPMEWTL